MATYTAQLTDGILKVGFNPNEPADNNLIVQDAVAACEPLRDQVAGKVLKINGPASLPVAIAIGHCFAHVVPAIACWDPKLKKYVVSISHSPDYKLGDLID